jgi:hypothetical protein
MPLLLHPHVVEVLNLVDDLLEGHDQWGSLETALAQLTETQTWQEERYRFFRQGQKRTPAIAELRIPVEEALEVRAEALAELAASRDLEALAAAARRLEKSSQCIARGSEALEVEDSRQRLSDFPLLHDFLQAGFNVYGDHEPFEVLKERLGPLVSWIGALQLDWADELELYDELQTRQPVFDEIIHLLQQGVGALFVYEEGRDSKDLLAALVQLQEAGASLSLFLAEPRPAGIREFDRLRLRTQRLGAEAESTSLARERVTALLESQRQQLRSLAELPVHSEEVDLAFAHAEEAWSRQVTALEAQDWEALNQAAQEFSASLERLGAVIASSSVDLREVPALQEIRRALLGVYYQQVPRRFLRDLVETIGPGFRQALEAEQEAEARLALELVVAALEQESVAEGLRLLNQAGPALLAVQSRRAEAAAREEEERRVSCTQCGLRQESAAACSGCGARLLRSDLGATSSSIWAEASGTALDEVFELVQRIRQGPVEEAEIRAVVDPLRERARVLLLRARSGGASEEYVSSLGEFQAGLELLAGQARERDLEVLEQGQAQLQQSSEEILAHR